MHSKKPSLPSIQFLLNNDSTDSNGSPESEVHAERNPTMITTTNYYSHSRGSSYNSTSSGNNASNITSSPGVMYHKKHNSSISSLPFELQQLSLIGPAPSVSVDSNKNNSQLDVPNHNSTSSSNKDHSRPSWMLPVTYSTNHHSYQQQPGEHHSYNIHVTSNATTVTHSRGRPSHASHGRSVSDFYLTNPVNTTTTAAIPSQQPQSHFPPSGTTTTQIVRRPRKPFQQHRRAISANPTGTVNVDGPLNSISTLPHIDEQLSTTRAQSNSLPPAVQHYTTSPLQQQEILLQQALNMISSTQKAIENKKPSSEPTTTQFIHKEVDDQNGDFTLRKEKQEEEEEEEEKKEPPSYSISTMSSSLVSRNETTGKYSCPYCYKAFSRPSSLKIHTYSHTGEKPFVCKEPGCGRQFSVQSNMRRHLRVHTRRRKKSATMAAVAAVAAVVVSATSSDDSKSNSAISTTAILEGKRKGKRGRKPMTVMPAATVIKSTEES